MSQQKQKIRVTKERWPQRRVVFTIECHPHSTEEVLTGPDDEECIRVFQTIQETTKDTSVFLLRISACSGCVDAAPGLAYRQFSNNAVIAVITAFLGVFRHPEHSVKIEASLP